MINKNKIIMGYDLRAKNKHVAEIRIGMFSWPLMLKDTGMGYVLGYGDNVQPGTYVYNDGNEGTPVSNDGYKVTAFEAKAMAAIARGYISVKRFINKQYEEMDETTRKYYESATFKNNDGTVEKLIKEQVTSEDFLLKLEKFAEFAEKSKGFTIH